MRVVLADDELIALKMLRKLIDWEGLKMKYCGYAQDGLALYQLIMEKRPDLVITDIMMPGMDGLKLIAKTQEAGLKIRFLITSAYANFSYAREAMRLGVKDFLEKPIDEEELNKALRRIKGDNEEKDRADNLSAEWMKSENEREISRSIQMAKEYIDRHYAERLTLEGVADQIYLSPNYLSSLFHREMDMSFVEYITDVRMRKAEKLLLDTRLTVADISRITGYRDAGYFCNVFQKKYGIVPTLWRKKIREK